eukprot:CAMPEP_0119052876 /NCGR_PEP_ID=MMETSP1177-20130426/74028_1 /TAXON_ID=2985 /ORGANISM="Ochromonas sp, Strain CCMP1899" /LENGTH=357 /DNA_ID=CAMNT_0007032587 /DNA_START=63 /DNA_END=1133 /DNA_ORIENTATION=+
MSQRNNAAVVEGNLNAFDSDDSSADEDDHKEITDSVVIDSIQSDDEFSSNYDKEEEELEIFSKIDLALGTDLHQQQPSIENANIKTNNSNQKPGISLIEAMSASVTQIEQANFMVTDNQPSKQSKSIDMNIREPITTNNPVVTAIDPSAEGPDVFGIAYKPFMKQKEEYNMPKGAAFEDEVEFQKELDELNRVKNSKIIDDDDEFDLDIEDNSDISKTVIEDESVVAKRAARIAKEIEEEEAFLESLKEETRLALESENKEIPIVLDLGEIKEKIEEKFSTKTLSKRALDDIVEVYSSGMGDQDVRLLDMNEKLNLNLKDVGTIEEGDEDEEDREEELAVVANAEKKYALSQTEAEW